jgi:hypothetical protein
MDRPSFLTDEDVERYLSAALDAGDRLRLEIRLVEREAPETKDQDDADE